MANPPRPPKGSLEELTDKQQTFYLAFTNRESPTHGNVEQSMKVADYAPNSRYSLLRSLRGFLEESSKIQVVSTTPKAIKLLEDVLETDIAILQESSKGVNIKVAVAQDILDRGGVGKKSEIDIKEEKHIAVVLLPSKETDAQIPIDVEFEELS